MRRFCVNVIALKREGGGRKKLPCLFFVILLKSLELRVERGSDGLFGLWDFSAVLALCWLE